MRSPTYVLIDLEFLLTDSQSLHVVDIVDVRELFEAYDIRADYSYERPMTGNNRTVIARASERLADLPKIWSAL
jgi:hypothetical protein